VGIMPVVTPDSFRGPRCPTEKARSPGFSVAARWTPERAGTYPLRTRTALCPTLRVSITVQAVRPSPPRRCNDRAGRWRGRFGLLWRGSWFVWDLEKVCSREGAKTFGSRGGAEKKVCSRGGAEGAEKKGGRKSAEGQLLLPSFRQTPDPWMRTLARASHHLIVSMGPGVRRDDGLGGGGRCFLCAASRSNRIRPTTAFAQAPPKPRFRLSPACIAAGAGSGGRSP
jgi:hypothetical protein